MAGFFDKVKSFSDFRNHLPGNSPRKQEDNLQGRIADESADLNKLIEIQKGIAVIKVTVKANGETTTFSSTMLPFVASQGGIEIMVEEKDSPKRYTVPYAPSNKVMVVCAHEPETFVSYNSAKVNNYAEVQNMRGETTHIIRLCSKCHMLYWTTPE